MNIYEIPLNQLLKDRQVYQIFDHCFRQDPWLNLTVLVDSESTIAGLHKDGMIPQAVLSDIVEHLKTMEKQLQETSSMKNSQPPMQG